MIVYNISSRKNPIIGIVDDIRSKPSENGFILQGEKFIYDTNPTDIKMLFVSDVRKHEELVNNVSESSKVYMVTNEVMKKLSGTVSSASILAVVQKQNCPMPNKLVLLDCVQDPGNVGTIVRTARAFGFGVICGGGADPLSEKSVRSSAGACISTYIKKLSLIEAVESLKEQGYCIVGTALNQYSCDLESVTDSAPEKIAFIVGSEGRGMSPKLHSLCDKTVYIPIDGVDSLNVAVAAGIVMYRMTVKS